MGAPCASVGDSTELCLSELLKARTWAKTDRQDMGKDRRTWKHGHQDLRLNQVVVTHTLDPSTRKAETGGSLCVQSQPGLRHKTLSKIKIKAGVRKVAQWLKMPPASMMT